MLKVKKNILSTKTIQTIILCIGKIVKNKKEIQN